MMIEDMDLPREVRDGAVAGADARALSFPVGTPIAEIERRMIHETLVHTRGDKKLAAKLLGIAPRTIYRRLEAEATNRDDE